MMKEIRILHLLPKLLSLYGEYGNVAVFTNELRKAGHHVAVDTWEEGKLCLDYDFIYIGSGTEDNLFEAVKRLMPYADAIRASAKERVWLATGNAMTLFGATISRGEQAIAGLNVFDYTTQIENGKRFLGDALTAEDTIGFINTSCVYHGIRNPLFQLLLNPSLGNDKCSAGDGIHDNNFYGTQLIGPVLAKNPHFMQQIAQKITGQPLPLAPESNIRMAYAASLRELKKRLS
jgi:CobQ-like glutamine amidotransferase family enzyme